MESCRPASGLGPQLPAPMYDCRTIHGALGVNVPSVCRYPGFIACGMGNGSVNGFRMNGLVGKTSMAWAPVRVSMSYGIGGSDLQLTDWPRATLAPIRAALPVMRLNWNSSRRLSFVKSKFIS